MKPSLKNPSLFPKAPLAALRFLSQNLTQLLFIAPGVSLVLLGIIVGIYPELTTIGVSATLILSGAAFFLLLAKVWHLMQRLQQAVSAIETKAAAKSQQDKELTKIFDLCTNSEPSKKVTLH